ncbi:MAG: methyltransferase domain-containing protein [Clostridia bacterium]|nr:methyltransferase domain-containing protein [Clostridia bacterium]
MQEKEIEYYERIENWNFDDIKCDTVKITDWDFYEKIKENTNKNSLCLDLGTGGGEKVLQKYPNVGMIIATDISKSMIKTAKENAKEYPDKKIKFVQMNNLQMTFPKGIFDLISARHTIINAKEIFECLSDEGTLVIQGIDKMDCIEIKKIFKRGQGYNDKMSIAEQDYNDLINAGFSRIEKVEILEDEYYETEDDLMALLLKTPILNDFSEVNNEKIEDKDRVKKDFFDEYVKRYKTERGILLKRRLYGIVAKK